MLRRSVWVLAFAAGLSSFTASLPVNAKEQISEEARAFFRNGVDLLQASPPNYQDAYYQFKLAFEKSNSWKVLGNMGLCAVNLERDGEALGYYDEYLKRGGKEINKEERAAIERDVLLIRGNAASVELNSAGADEVELLDARSGSSAPAQTYIIGADKKTLTLRAGTHTLTATAKDGRTLKWDVALTPGKVAHHEFDFNAPAEPVAKDAAEPPPAPIAQTTAPEPAPAAESRTSPLRTIGFVTGGVGLALLGSGAVTGIMAKSKESDVDKKCQATPDNCDPSVKPTLDSAASLAKVTNVLLISGAVVTLTGVGLVVFGGKSSAQTARANVTFVPVFAGNSGGLVAAGSF